MDTMRDIDHMKIEECQTGGSKSIRQATNDFEVYMERVWKQMRNKNVRIKIELIE